MFGAFAGWQTVALKAHRKLCCGLGPGVPVGEVALALGCLLGRVFGGFWRVWRVLGGLEGLDGFGGFGAFLALGSLLGTVFGGFGGFWRVWRVWKVLECLTLALKAHRKLCCGLGPGVPVGEVALALGCLLGRVFGGFWRVFGGFGGFWGVWRVWRVLEGLERLRAGKR